MRMMKNEDDETRDVMSRVLTENVSENVALSPRTENVACANDACPRHAEPGDAYCSSCGLERSLFTRRGGERDSGAYERPGR